MKSLKNRFLQPLQLKFSDVFMSVDGQEPRYWLHALYSVRHHLQLGHQQVTLVFPADVDIMKASIKVGFHVLDVRIVPFWKHHRLPRDLKA